LKAWRLRILSGMSEKPFVDDDITETRTVKAESDEEE